MLKKSNPSICSHFTWLVVIIYCSGCSESLGSLAAAIRRSDFGDFIRDRSRQYVLQSKQYAQGTKFAESRLLEYSVVLLGFTVTFQTISEMGIRGFVFIVLMMTIVITAAYLIGKKLGFNQK